MTSALVLAVAVGCVALSWQAPGATGHAFRAAADTGSPRIAALRMQVASGNRNAVGEFWKEVRTRGTPLVEPLASSSSHSLVTFLWRGNSGTRNVVIVDGVAAGAGGTDPANSTMTRLGTTDVWYRTYEVRNDARFTYQLSENDSMRSFLDPARGSRAVVDPLNPRLYAGQSSLELPAAPPQIGLRQPAPAAGGTVDATLFTSEQSGNARPVWVYTPRGFMAGRPYPLVVVLDGSAYTTLVPVPRILDALIDLQRIPPVVAVMVDTSLFRVRDLSCSAPFADFLALELVPWMRRTYGAGADAATTVVAGSSLGGLAAACASAAHRDVFGAALSQSGSFWWKPEGSEPEWLTRQLAGGAPAPARMFIEVGAMEIPEQLETNRRLRDAVRSRGAAVTYREFNGNHTYLQWRGGFADGVTALLGAATP